MSEQQRKHHRLPIESTTFIELVAPRAGQNAATRMVTCKTMNVSRGGLQVIVAEELSVGAILRIGVVLPGAQDTLYLAGEVRWCLPGKDEQHSWMAGFQLLDAQATDIASWVELITTLET